MHVGKLRTYLQGDTKPCSSEETRRMHFNDTYIVQHSKFNIRYQKQGESVAKFIAELSQIAQFCGYDAVLKDMLCDCLICGVNDTKMQQRLLVEPEPLTLKRGFEVAQAIEIAEQKANYAMCDWLNKFHSFSLILIHF